ECSDAFLKVFEGSDGILFFGGPDLVPAIYGEETSLLTVVTDPYRHYWEASMLFHLLGGSQDINFPALLNRKPDYAILGICLGMQTMNVATGGTMIQDIPSEAYGATTVEEILGLDASMMHRNYFTNLYPNEGLDWGGFHPVKWEDPLPTAYRGLSVAPTPIVLSSHHQAVEQPGQGLVVLARSTDGRIIEMVGHERFPHVLGVQFHPEVTALYDTEAMFRISPADGNGISFQQQYAVQDLGFHRMLWKTFGSWLSVKSSSFDRKH
ncbi:MAG TPA: gamma-glutamyl-gamma-aminobutyrate hydrolase family protein, partial [Bacteroidales bacterium]|nr:gamma-glutamyl-gamma-aminobutyrate hydrolase family protein [Bacteroidales bacterium]